MYRYFGYILSDNNYINILLKLVFCTSTCLCLGHCVQVIVVGSLCLGCCVWVAVFRLLCFGRLHSGFSNHCV